MLSLIPLKFPSCPLIGFLTLVPRFFAPCPLFLYSLSIFWVGSHIDDRLTPLLSFSPYSPPTSLNFHLPHQWPIDSPTLLSHFPSFGDWLTLPLSFSPYSPSVLDFHLPHRRPIDPPVPLSRFPRSHEPPSPSASLHHYPIAIVYLPGSLHLILS